ncbi:MAG: hypothetical protein HS111_35925 [Kofleriaceae bacterium]|nr:hypothetical protein [Kofleriaceae bacterium]
MSQARIDADEVVIGTGTVIHPSAVLCGPDGGRARRVVVGDHCYLGESVQIRCADFRLGDFGKLHHHTNIHGALPCAIGHNAWIGQYTIIDSTGGATLGDNAASAPTPSSGATSSSATRLEGCRFLGERPLTVGKDVWFVGHCVVSPVVAHDKSMAMVGSVITRDMAANRVYAGAPAVDVTAKVGPQFAEVPSPTRSRACAPTSRPRASTPRPCASSPPPTRSSTTSGRGSWSPIAPHQARHRGRGEVAFMRYACRRAAGSRRRAGSARCPAAPAPPPGARLARPGSRMRSRAASATAVARRAARPRAAAAIAACRRCLAPSATTAASAKRDAASARLPGAPRRRAACPIIPVATAHGMPVATTQRSARSARASRRRAGGSAPARAIATRARRCSTATRACSMRSTSLDAPHRRQRLVEAPRAATASPSSRSRGRGQDP